jgi:hypothetical protein
MHASVSRVIAAARRSGLEISVKPDDVVRASEGRVGDVAAST